MSKVITLQGLSRFLANCKTFFQDKLRSGVNIKTINNTSLLGPGNIKLGGSGATVLTAPGGDSLIIPIPRGEAGLKGSYRIDMTAQYTGGSEVRYIGSLIIECNELASQRAKGYYYGYDLSEILSGVSIWKDDPEIYSPDNLGYYLLLKVEADLDEVIFSVSSLDGDDVSASIGNEDEKVKVADATIRVFELTSNKVTTLSKTSTNDEYAGALAVYNEIHPAPISTLPAEGLAPNVLYNLGTLAGSIVILLASPADANIINHYYFTFDTGASAPTITWPAAVTKWRGGNAPAINANKHYEISILGGVGAYMEV